MSRNKTYKSYISILLLLILVSVIFPVKSAYAAEALNLSVTPAFYELNGEPGRLVRNKIRLRNNNNTPVDLNIQMKKLSSMDVTGEIKLDEPTGQEDFINWVHLDKTVITAFPKEWIDIPFTINIPSDAAFGYYWAFYLTLNGDTKPVSGATRYMGAVAVPVLLNVKNEGAKISAEIESFKTESNFYEFLPVKFNTLVNNTGNVHLKPVGNIFISDWRGKEVENLAFNPSGGNILPGTKRNFETMWQNSFITYEDLVEDGAVIHDRSSKPVQRIKFHFDKLLNMRIGKYYAKAVIVINDGKYDIPVEATTSFIVFPWKILLSLTVFILLAVVGLVSVLKSIGTKTKAAVQRKKK